MSLCQRLLIRTTRFYGLFSLSVAKAPFFLNSNRLIPPPVRAENGLIFLVQLQVRHRKVNDHLCQLCTAIRFKFMKLKKPWTTEDG